MDRTLISPENSFFRNTVGVALFVPIVLIAIVAKTLILPFERPSKISASEVAVYLREFIEGTGGAWDWDDFISVPIADPQLESVRTKASRINPLIDDEGMNKLRLLLFEVEGIIETGETHSKD